MSVAQINSKVAEAITAQESGDYDTALLKLRSAQLLLAVLPDSVHEQQELSWDRSAIAAAIRAIEQQAAAILGIGYTQMDYVRPDAEE